MAIRIGIMGYGNLGKGVEKVLPCYPDMDLRAIFTRRDPSLLSSQSGVPILRTEEAPFRKKEIDVLVICGGSQSDLKTMTPEWARHFNVVDSFDTHGLISQHFDQTDHVARAYGHIAIISAGWDPGLFSLARLYAQAALPLGNTATFWGKGVSQGHSQAARSCPGVQDAICYTIPDPAMIESALQTHVLPSGIPLHRRECYIVPKEGADRQAIISSLCSIEHYFAGEHVEVHFISAQELAHDHHTLSHGGQVIRTGSTSGENAQQFVLRLSMDSNPEYTAGILLSCARAAHRLSFEGRCGCRTMLDIPPVYLAQASAEQLRREL